MRSWRHKTHMMFTSMVAVRSIDRFLMSSKIEKRHDVPWLDEMHMSAFFCVLLEHGLHHYILSV
uniref:Uncharacterized protein n=1 Tax=Triticum urartu TaxID=4572 RepID=A0A8R7U2R1_TRIUA